MTNRQPATKYPERYLKRIRRELNRQSTKAFNGDDLDLFEALEIAICLVDQKLGEVRKASRKGVRR